MAAGHLFNAKKVNHLLPHNFFKQGGLCPPRTPHLMSLSSGEEGGMGGDGGRASAPRPGLNRHPNRPIDVKPRQDESFR